MRYAVWAVLLVSLGLLADTLSPKFSVKTSSPVLDFVVRDNSVWAGTANGEAVHISLKGSILSIVTVPSRVDAWGEKVPQKIMSIDVAPDGKRMILAGEDGTLYLVREGKITKTSFSTQTVIKKIAFVSDRRILLALLSNEAVFFDLGTNRVIKTLGTGTSPLSDMAISSDRKTAVIAGEAGVVSVIDTFAMKWVRNIQGGNVDNIYKLDFQNSRIVTAGQDRRAIIYTQDGKKYSRYDGTFLIYAAALSPSAGRMAATMDEQNTVTLFDTAKRRTIATAKGHTATLNRIAFIDEKQFVSCADENKILFWEIP